MSQIPAILHISLVIMKGSNDIMYTFTIVVHIANVYIIFLPPFIQ